MNQDRGVSPVISVILMLGLAVSIAAIASLTAFDLQNDVSTNPDITLQANDGDATATVVDAGNVDELKLDGVVVNTDVSAGDTLDLAGAGSSASVIAVVDGQEQLVEQVETGVPFSSPNSTRGTIGDEVFEEEGTASDPYKISTDRELQAMENDTAKHYELTQNIDAGKSGQWNDGDGFNPVGTFTGTFDGQGHTIAGLTIDRTSTNLVGLFGKISSSSEITNVTVTTADVTGNKNVGGLVGRNNDGTVKKSSASGSVTGLNKNVGGLVGRNDGAVKDSSASGSVTGNIRLGGLVGRNDGAVKDSSATGTVTGNAGVGGLVGRNSGTVKDSSASGSVTRTGSGSVGGLVGFNNGGTVSESYWDELSTGQSTTASNAAKGFSTDSDTDGRADEMIGDAAKTNMSFDFPNTWEAVDGERPVLQNLDKQSQLAAR